MLCKSDKPSVIIIIIVMDDLRALVPLGLELDMLHDLTSASHLLLFGCGYVSPDLDLDLSAEICTKFHVMLFDSSTNTKWQAGRTSSGTL